MTWHAVRVNDQWCDDQWCELFLISALCTFYLFIVTSSSKMHNSLIKVSGH